MKNWSGDYESKRSPKWVVFCMNKWTASATTHFDWRLGLSVIFGKVCRRKIDIFFDHCYLACCFWMAWFITYACICADNGKTTDENKRCSSLWKPLHSLLLAHICKSKQTRGGQLTCFYSWVFPPSENQRCENSSTNSFACVESNPLLHASWNPVPLRWHAAWSFISPETQIKNTTNSK